MLTAVDSVNNSSAGRQVLEKVQISKNTVVNGGGKFASTELKPPVFEKGSRNAFFKESENV